MNTQKHLVARRILGCLAVVGICTPLACERAAENDLGLSPEVERLLLQQYRERVAAKPNDIRGRVLSTLEMPLEGVAVSVAGKQVATDSNGEFLVPDVPQGICGN